MKWNTIGAQNKFQVQGSKENCYNSADVKHSKFEPRSWSSWACRLNSPSVDDANTVEKVMRKYFTLLYFTLAMH